MSLRVAVRVEDDRITPYLKRLKGGIPAALRDSIRGIAHDIRNTAMASMQKPKSGRTYRRGSIEHQASAPGEPPAVDTGDLLAHISVAARQTFTDVGAEVLHGLYMEGGTQVGGSWRVEPRPFLIPAYAEHEDKLEAALIRHVGRI